MKAILDLVAHHKAGEPCGIYSVCSAHALVIEAALLHTLRRGAPFALIEATSNQVNQEGGYTGMQPAGFREFVHQMADRVGLSRDRVLLGGDHLGPNAWQALPVEDAMARAEVLIDDYVRAGFRKIHLDCSMRCADDPAALSDEMIARRAARLCAVAEGAHELVHAVDAELLGDPVEVHVAGLRDGMAHVDGSMLLVVPVLMDAARQGKDAVAVLGLER